MIEKPQFLTILHSLINLGLPTNSPISILNHDHLHLEKQFKSYCKQSEQAIEWAFIELYPILQGCLSSLPAGKEETGKRKFRRQVSKKQKVLKAWYLCSLLFEKSRLFRQLFMKHLNLWYAWYHQQPQHSSTATTSNSEFLFENYFESETKQLFETAKQELLEKLKKWQIQFPQLSSIQTLIRMLTGSPNKIPPEPVIMVENIKKNKNIYRRPEAVEYSLFNQISNQIHHSKNDDIVPSSSNSDSTINNQKDHLDRRKIQIVDKIYAEYKNGKTEIDFLIQQSQSLIDLVLNSDSDQNSFDLTTTTTTNESDTSKSKQKLKIKPVEISLKPFRITETLNNAILIRNLEDLLLQLQKQHLILNSLLKRLTPYFKNQKNNVYKEIENDDKRVLAMIKKCEWMGIETEEMKRRREEAELQEESEFVLQD